MRETEATFASLEELVADAMNSDSGHEAEKLDAEEDISESSTVVAGPKMLGGAPLPDRQKVDDALAVKRFLHQHGGGAMMQIIASVDPESLRAVPVGSEQAAGFGEFEWCSTFITRTRFYPLAPERNAYDIADIAHALSRVNRWAGHINVETFSVAQHSVNVSNVLTHPAARYLAILHDAPEYMLGDMTRPLKREIPEYKAIEQRHSAEIFRRYGIRDRDVKAHWLSVRIADDATLRVESLLLQEMQQFPVDWHWKPMAPNAARDAFLDAYHSCRHEYLTWLAAQDAQAA